MIFRNPFPLCKYDAFLQHRWRFTEYNTAKRENQTKHRGLHSRSAAVRRYSTAACKGNVIFFKIYINYVIKEKTVGLSFISSQALTNGSHGDDDGSHSSTVANILRD